MNIDAGEVLAELQTIPAAAPWVEVAALRVQNRALANQLAAATADTTPKDTPDTL
jgi:hypothetical protein